MTLDRLWAAWRYGYVAQATERDRAGEGDGTPGRCVFCRLGDEAEPSAENLVVHRGPLAYAALNLYPYGSGHLLVVPRRHEPDLEALDDEEAAALFATTREAVGAVNRAYDPDGLNVGANLGRAAGAGIPDHLHFHVLPRWAGDTNFMTSIGGTRVLPEPLEVTWQKLHDAWPR